MKTKTKVILLILGGFAFFGLLAYMRVSAVGLIFGIIILLSMMALAYYVITQANQKLAVPAGYVPDTGDYPAF